MKILKKYNVMILISLTLASTIYSAPLKEKANEATINLRLPHGVIINNKDVQQGFKILDEGRSLLFVFYPPLFEQENMEQVFVAGTFTRWKEKPEWQLKRHKRSGLWILKVSLDKVAVPGNSGQPEFKFVVKTGKPGSTWLSSKSPWQLGANNLILFPGDDTNVLNSNIELALTLKTPQDFDLSDPESEAMLANFRRAPGTQNLFRSYHPYKISRALNKTEKTRIQTVKKLMKENSVRSVICLSDNEKAFATSSEYISDYHQKIIDNNHELFEKAHYNMVYYESAGKEFGLMVQRIVEFIIKDDNKGPFLVHCRLGTDRTGVMVGILSGLCGTPWKQIREDYQKSNNMGMQEFRDYKLLKYSLEQVIGKKISDETDLKTELSSYFITNGYLTQLQIDELNRKLK